MNNRLRVGEPNKIIIIIIIIIIVIIIVIRTLISVQRIT